MTALIVAIVVILSLASWWLTLPTCGACDKKVYPWNKAFGISPPASCTIHAGCKKNFHDKWNQEPYKSITEDYKNMLEKQREHKDRTGRPLSKEEWDKYKRRKASLLT